MCLKVNYTLIGSTKIVMAVKKCQSIGNSIIRNKSISLEPIQQENQKCNAPNCQQCPLVNSSNSTSVNRIPVRASKKLNFKSETSYTYGNVSYVKTKTVTSDEQYKKYTKGRMVTEHASVTKNGKIQHC